MPKNSLVGRTIPDVGVPLGVLGIEVRGLGVGVKDGRTTVGTTGVVVITIVAVGVGIEVVGDGVKVGVVLCPEPVAVKTGRLLSPWAMTTKERLIFLTKPCWSV